MLLLCLLAVTATPLPLSDLETVANVTTVGEGLRPGCRASLAGEQTHAGARAVRVDYDFVADPPGLQYVGWATDLLLPPAATRFRVWVHGDGAGQIIALRLRDPGGETHQWRLGRADHTGWRQMTADIAMLAEHWGGDEDGVIGVPLRFDSLLVDSAVEPASGTIWFDDLSVELGDQRLPPEAVPLLGDRPLPALDAVYLEVTGDGAGRRLAVEIEDAAGARHALDYAPVDWTGPIRIRVDGRPLAAEPPWRLVGVRLEPAGELAIGPIHYLPRRVAPRPTMVRLDGCERNPPPVGGELVQPGSRLRLDTDRKQAGLASWRLDYQFAEAVGIQYVAVPVGAPLGESPTRLRVAVWGDRTGNDLRCRLVDASGEYHQHTLGPLEFDGWFEFELDLTAPPQVVWGGDENGHLDGAVRLDSILVDSSVKPSSGTVWIDEVRGEAAMRPADLVEVGITFDRPGGIYTDAAPASATVTATWRGDEADRPETLAATLFIDGVGESVAPRRVDLPLTGAPTPLALPAVVGPAQVELRLHWEIDYDATSAMQSYCRLPAMPPTDRETNLFGACLHYQQHKGRVPLNYELLAAAGGRWARDEYSWSTVERERGVYTFPDHNEEYMRAAGRFGLRHLIILDYGNALYDDGAAPASDEAQAAFAEYAYQMVDRYGDVCRHWEVYNEPNIGFWRPEPDPVAYTRLLKRTYEAIKRADAEAVVVGICTAGVDFAFIETVLEEGGGAFMDALSVHPYRYPRAPEESNFVADLERLHALMEQHGIGDMPIWLTEIGWPNQEDARGVSEQQSADYLVRMVSLARSLPYIGPIMWYDLQNDGTNRAYNEDNFGLIRLDFSPKRPYFAAAVMNSQIADKAFVAAHEAGHDTWLHQYAGDGVNTLLAWCTTGERRLRLRLDGAAELLRLDGRREALQPVDGVVELTVGPSPVFVTGGYTFVGLAPGAELGR